MKKLLIYLVLITCFESFISATADICYKVKKASQIIDINIFEKDESFDQDSSVKTEVYPLNIFTLRYF